MTLYPQPPCKECEDYVTTLKEKIAELEQEILILKKLRT